MVAATAALLVRVPARAVDGWYGGLAYPFLQRAVTGASNVVPFALFDLALLSVAGWVLLEAALVVRGPSGGRLRALRRGLARLVVGAAAVYLAFLALWGLNYRRAPLSERLDFAAARVTPAAIERLALGTIAELGRLRPAASSPVPGAGAWRAALGPAFARAQEAMGLPGGAVAGRPKRSILDPYFTRAGVSGMTDPFFLETLVASNLLPFERPSVIAHEWGHLAGYARESEASFFAWVVCLHGDDAVRYSGQLELLLRLLAAIEPAARARLIGRVSPGVARDIAAIAERNRRAQMPAVTRTAWRIYDRYLRTNRVESGVRNYDEVVALVVGTRFVAAGVPAPRARPAVAPALRPQGYDGQR